MTSESASQSISPGRADDIPPSFDERTVLTTFLDYARDTVHAKCAGLSDADARRAPLPVPEGTMDSRPAAMKARDEGTVIR